MTSRSTNWCLPGTLIAVLLLSGCQTIPPAAVRQPELRLTSSAPLQIADNCQPGGSVLVQFTVLADGATSGIQTPAVPQCLHDALTAWVTSFRYVPPGVTVPGTVEWLLVTAKKGS